MSVILKADNRALVTGAKYSFLSTNYASGVSSLVLVNADGFVANQYVLLGNFGSETAEVARVATVTSSTNTITLKDDAGSTLNTRFAHPESTKVTIIPYNQIRFYYTATTTFGTSDPVTAQSDITASDWYSIGADSAHTTGYGWFVYYNVGASTNSTNSAAIPYAGFGGNTVQNVIDGFFSILNNKELRLITQKESYDWLNEAYSIVKDELNLVNHEFSVSTPQTVSIVAGTEEYALPSDFSDMVTVYNAGALATGADNPKIKFIDLEDVDTYIGTEPRYYIRGSYIGFKPTPDGTESYKYRYSKKITELTLFSDNFDLPGNAFYAIKDYMLYRAYQKLTSPNSSVYYKAFRDWCDRTKVVSMKRDANPDSWSIAANANV